MASTQTGDSPAEQAKDKAQQAGQQAKSRVRDEVDRRSTEAGEQATSVAEAIRQASQQLREQGKDSAAKPIEQAADRVESAGRWLRDSDGERILSDVEDFGRRNPLAVVAGGAAIGFALSRLLKASSTERYRTSRSGSTARSGNGNGYTGAALPPAPAGGQAGVDRPGGVAVPDLPAPPIGSPTPPVGSPDAPAPGGTGGTYGV
jgi:ElaB/YqjD/DUF883 family membrane-anchored ribosome-binding protein